MRDESIVGHQHSDQMRAFVAIDHGLAELRFEDQHPLDALGRDIVATRIDDDVLLAICDLDVAVFVQLTDIAGMDPAVTQGFGGQFGAFQ